MQDFVQNLRLLADQDGFLCPDLLSSRRSATGSVSVGVEIGGCSQTSLSHRENSRRQVGLNGQFTAAQTEDRTLNLRVTTSTPDQPVDRPAVR